MLHSRILVVIVNVNLFLLRQSELSPNSFIYLLYPGKIFRIYLRRCPFEWTPFKTFFCTEVLAQELSFLFFFLVLCLPRQVRKSNGATHYDAQLSTSTFCNLFHHPV